MDVNSSAELSFYGVRFGFGSDLFHYVTLCKCNLSYIKLLQYNFTLGYIIAHNVNEIK